MKTNFKNVFGLIFAITLLLGLANATAQAAEITSPDRPERPQAKGNSANAGELKQIIKSFQEQKKEFLSRQKDERVDARGKLREEVGGGGAATEVKDAVAEAKLVAREQARKLAEEARNSAKEGRKRD